MYLMWILGAPKSTARRSTEDEATDDSRGVKAIPVTSQPPRQIELFLQSPACPPDGREALPAPPGSCPKPSSAPGSCSSDPALGEVALLTGNKRNKGAMTHWQPFFAFPSPQGS